MVDCLYILYMCMQILQEIPEAFLLSLTRIYLSSVITYSLMYKTLAWLDGGGAGGHKI